jgi:hypothetical protein
MSFQINVAGVVEVVARSPLIILPSRDSEPRACFCRLSIPFLPFREEGVKSFASAPVLSSDSVLFSHHLAIIGDPKEADAGRGPGKD